MSFKRVADDFDDFKLQKKRRVNDLLLEFIPSDEAILMKNGKLACLVCSHRPVFDTTTMLSIHRKGKKHLSNSLVKLERAKEDAEIRQKQEQESFLKMKKDISDNPLLGLTQMKKAQALNESLQSHSTNECASVRGNLIANQDAEKPFFGKKTNSSFEKSSSCMAGSCVPWKSFDLRDMKSVRGDFIASQDTEKPFFGKKTNSSFEKSSSCMAGSCVPWKSFDLRDMKSNPRRDKFLSVNPLTKQNITCKSETPVPKSRNIEDIEPNQSKRPAFYTSETGSPSVPKRASSSTFFSHDQHSTLNNLDPNLKAQYLAKLRQIGWILGTDGKWEKDVSAEFESDEDEPPSPRTVLSG